MSDKTFYRDGDVMLIRGDEIKKKCRVDIPGLGECECAEDEHKIDGLGRQIHVHGACSWNGGNLIEIHDKGMEITGRLRVEDV